MRRLTLSAALAIACQTGKPPGGGPDGDDTTDDTDLPAPICITPSLSVSASAAGAAVVTVPVLPRGDLQQAVRFASRAFTLSAVSGTADQLTVDVTAPYRMFTDAGDPLTLPAAFSVDQLPVTVLVATDAFDDGALTVTSTGDCAGLTQDLHATPRTELAARALGSAPWASTFETFRTDDKVDVVIDPAELPDRVGLPYAIHVVKHHTPEEWLADNTLVDETGAAETGTLAAGPLREHITRVWEAPRVDDVYASAWDVVVDFGGDGRLDPGDIIDGLGKRPGFYTAGDLEALGPYTPTRKRLNDGQWLQEEVWYPEEVQQIDGLLPLVVMSHGNGHDFRWYGHMGEHLASWGFVFMSHSNNTGPGIQTAATTTLSNTEHFVANHAQWWNGELAGKVDVHNIAWIGHSRGGEGVVRAYDRLFDGFNPGSYTVDDITVVSSIAPTVFLGVRGSNPHNVPYHLLYGSADGDVNGGADCDLCQSLRIPYAGTGDVVITYLQGASHNSFHTDNDWDGAGPNQLPQETVHQVQKPTYLALLGWQQRGIEAYKSLLTANADAYRPLGMPLQPLIATVWKEAQSIRKRTLDAFQVEEAAEVNDLGGAVEWTVENVVEDLLDDGNVDFQWRAGDPMNGMTLVNGDGFERGVVFDWTGPANYVTHIPQDAADFREFDFLSLRACQGTRHPYTDAHDGPLVFAVALVDGTGNAAMIELEPFGSVTRTYQREGLGAGAGWANEMNTLRVPLRQFLTDDVAVAAGTRLNLGDIREVRLLFGPEHGSETGRLGLDDIYLGRW